MDYWIVPEGKHCESIYVSNIEKTENSYSFSMAAMCEENHPETAAYTCFISYEIKKSEN